MLLHAQALRACGLNCTHYHPSEHSNGAANDRRCLRRFSGEAPRINALAFYPGALNAKKPFARYYFLGAKDRPFPSSFYRDGRSPRASYENLMRALRGAAEVGRVGGLWQPLKFLRSKVARVRFPRRATRFTKVSDLRGHISQCLCVCVYVYTKATEIERGTFSRRTVERVV